MLLYSNPRREVIIPDWPYGKNRCTCHFYVENKKGSERAVRVTENPKTGRKNNPKRLTYVVKVLFVDGSDGKTYVMQDTSLAIKITQSNMQYTQEYINVDDSRYESLKAMFKENTMQKFAKLKESGDGRL